MNKGRIVFLLDSFDEMAQHLKRNTIRDNLKEILIGISNKSKAIMTSRPNFFEGRAERLLLVEKNGSLEWHDIDKQQYSFRIRSANAYCRAGQRERFLFHWIGTRSAIFFAG
jgi:predicted NACHT family NTPase